MKEMGLHFPGYKMKGMKMGDSRESLHRDEKENEYCGGKYWLR